MLKYIKKIFILFGTVCLCSLTSCSAILPINYEINYSVNQNKTNFDNYENKNAIIENAENVATNENVLVYVINWVATTHKYVPFAHALKVLEKNPTQEIYFYISSYVFTKDKLDISIFDKYQNVKINFIENDPNNNWKNLSLIPLKFFLYDINNKFDKTKKYHYYTDDYSLMKIIDIDQIVTKRKILNFIDTYLQFINFTSINLIADGTASYNFWKDSFYKFFKKDLLALDENLGTYTSYKILENMKDEIFLEKTKQWLLKDGQNYKIFIAVLLTTYNVDGIVTTNYFVPSTSMIIDFNNSSSESLSLNDKYNEYFDPYNSLNLNFIELFNSLNNESFEKFFKIFKTNNPNVFSDEFENSYNIIYTGSLIDNDKGILEKETNRLINLYEKYKDVSKLKIWFKGHPRDSDDLIESLTNNLIVKGYQNASDWFYGLDKTIPMELYLASDLFQATENKTIVMYTTFSTYVLFLECDNKLDLIEKIIVSESDLKTINYIYGDPSESICFPENKLTQTI